MPLRVLADVGGLLKIGLGLHHHIQTIPADLRLQLVRAALRDHPAAVDHDDLIGQTVGPQRGDTSQSTGP